MRKMAAGIGIRMPTATHGEKSGAWLDGGGVGSEHQLRVLYTIHLVARQSAASEPPAASPSRRCPWGRGGGCTSGRRSRPFQVPGAASDDEDARVIGGYEDGSAQGGATSGAVDRFRAPA